MSVENISIRYSNPAAGGGNSETQGDPSQSLGLYVSTTEWSGSAYGALFSDDNLTGTTAYRCVFATNAGSYYTLRHASVYVPEVTATEALLAVGVDPLYSTSVFSTAAQAALIPDESTAPIGVEFTLPLYGTTALPIGDLEPMRCRGLWIRRISTGTQSSLTENMMLRLTGTLTL